MPPEPPRPSGPPGPNDPRNIYVPSHDRLPEPSRPAGAPLAHTPVPPAGNFHLPRQADAYQMEPQPPAQPEPVVVQPSNAAPPRPVVQPVQPGGPASPYDFITNSAKPSRQFTLPGGNSLLSRILILGGGLIVLFILFAVFKSLLSGPPKYATYIAVVQDQQEIIHLATAATQQQGISPTNQNFAATAQLSVSSAQSAFVTYLTTNGQKLDKKVINLKLSTALDTQLQNAAAATTYDQTFQQIMKNELTAYANDMRQAYGKNTGPKGQTLLKSNFSQAQLLLVQLNTPGQ